MLVLIDLSMAAKCLTDGIDGGEASRHLVQLVLGFVYSVWTPNVSVVDKLVLGFVCSFCTVYTRFDEALAREHIEEPGR